MTCEVCHKGIADGVALFRQNATGQKGIWRCREHNQKPIAPDVDAITAIIEQDNQERSR